MRLNIFPRGRCNEQVELQMIVFYPLWCFFGSKCQFVCLKPTRRFVSKLGTAPQTHGYGWFWIGKPHEHQFSGILIVRYPYFSIISTQPLCFNLFVWSWDVKSCEMRVPEMVVKKGAVWQLFQVSLWGEILHLRCIKYTTLTCEAIVGSTTWLPGWIRESSRDWHPAFRSLEVTNAGLIIRCRNSFFFCVAIFSDQIQTFTFWCFHLGEGRNVTQLGFCFFFKTAFDAVFTVPPFLPLIWMSHVHFGFKRLYFWLMHTRIKGDDTWNRKVSKVVGSNVDGDHLRMRGG